jgi:hypothetical protein
MTLSTARPRYLTATERSGPEESMRHQYVIRRHTFLVCRLESPSRLHGEPARTRSRTVNRNHQLSIVGQFVS